ncbi:MAG: PAS domain S-box protein, partial [Nitrospinae bacterium]|nr:PAS domain S-box protein [Nitrospinota bacterium]
MKKVLLIGAGRGGSALLPILCEDKDIEIVGVADIDSNAPGLKVAEELGIPTTSDYAGFLRKNHVDVVLNLTGDHSISDRIMEEKDDIEVLGALSAKIMWNLVNERKKREAEKTRLAEDLEHLNAALLESKEYLENILEHSADMIITTDINRRIIMFNKGAENMLGFGRDEIIGSSAEELYYNKSERQKMLGMLDKDGSISSYETKLKTKDGRLIDISLTISQLKNSAGEVIGTVGISKDITEKKKLETKLKETNQELENFVYTVSHDLKAPLRAINGFSGFLLEDYGDKIKEDGRHYMERIKSGVKQMQTL